MGNAAATGPGNKNLHQGLSKSATKRTNQGTSRYKKLKTEAEKSTGEINVFEDNIDTRDDTVDLNRNITSISDIKPKDENKKSKLKANFSSMSGTDNRNESDNLLKQNIAQPIIKPKAVKVKNVVHSDVNKKKTKKEKTPREIPSSFPCRKCDETFTAKTKLRAHIQKEHRKVQCDVCGRHFANLGSMKEHKRRHTGETPFVCQHCGMTFRARKTLRNHEKLHTGEKPFQCDVCQQRFVQRTGLNYHMKRNHVKDSDSEKPMDYQHGGKSSRDHERTHTTGEKPYRLITGGIRLVCHYCGKAYRSKKSLENHERLHSVE